MSNFQREFTRFMPFLFVNVAVIYLPIVLMLANVGGVGGDSSMLAMSLNLFNPIVIAVTSVAYGLKYGIKVYFPIYIGVITVPLIWILWVMGGNMFVYLAGYMLASLLCVVICGAMKKRRDESKTSPKL